jgi:hypothetical protein
MLVLFLARPPELGLPPHGKGRRRFVPSQRSAATTPEVADELRECVYHRFPARFPDRDAVASGMSAAGVATGVHDALPLQRQPALQGSLRHAGSAAARRGMGGGRSSLPMSPGLTRAGVETAAWAYADAARP